MAPRTFSSARSNRHPRQTIERDPKGISAPSRTFLYALGHSNFDQPGYENAKEGLVVRVIIQGKTILRVSFVPVTRDNKNDVTMLDPSSAEGAKLVQMVRDRSFAPPSRRIDGQEVVMLEKAATTSNNKR
jgi:hypothetical protein